MKIDLQIPEYKELTEPERKEYCATIFAVFPRLEKDIKEKMYEQLINTYTESIGTTKNAEERDFEVVRGNGIMEGMAILLELWRLASMEHQARPEEERS